MEIEQTADETGAVPTVGGTTLEKVRELMQQIREYKLEEERYAALEKEVKEKAKPLREEVQAIMEKNEMTTVKFPGIGRFTVSTEVSTKFPEDLADRKLVFDWLLSKGEDWLLSYAAVESRKFNKLYNEMISKGEIIPGAMMPKEYKLAKFTPER